MKFGCLPRELYGQPNKMWLLEIVFALVKYFWSRVVKWFDKILADLEHHDSPSATVDTH